MERMHFKKTISAPVEKVYETMIGKQTFKLWNRAFNPSSEVNVAEGDKFMEKGAKMLFTSTNNAGKREGLISYVREHDPRRFVSFEHVGIIDGDKEIYRGSAVDAWKGFESYTFHGDQSQTTVHVEVDVHDPMKNYLKETYPKALDKLEEICTR